MYFLSKERFDMPDPVILDFSGIYREETFWKRGKAREIELYDIPGTNCYCDEEAAREIERRTYGIPERSLRYIDSGNYHYVSFLLAEQVRFPFNLLVFDHHTDMQRPQFGEILSCGGWIRYLINNNSWLNKVILVGPSKEDFEETEENLKEKTVLISEPAADEERIIRSMETSGNLPLYISVDKDILRPEDAQTTWTQGNMKGTTLLVLLDAAVRMSGKENVIALDICGESSPEDGNSEPNDRMNRKILEWYRKVFHEE